MTQAHKTLSLFGLTEDDRIILEHGLKAQARLLPFALSFFAIGLPIFIWACLMASNLSLLGLSLALFLINWGVFYALQGSLRALHKQSPKDPKAAEQRLFAMVWRHGLSALVWVLSLNFMAFLAIGEGASAHIVLLVLAGASVGVIFFNVPILTFLLILGPLSVLGPVIALHLQPETQELGHIVLGAMALALAMGFAMNRHLVQHYHLEHEQWRLSQERELAMSHASEVNDTKMALMRTLSREIFTGLKGLELNLAQAQSHLLRAPIPRQLVDSALTQALHLQSILITTLDNETAQSGLMQLEHVPMDCVGIIQKLMDLYSPQAQAKGLELSFVNQAPEEGAALGDAQRTSQIMGHLISNALLYTQKGRIEISIGLVGLDTLRLKVIDSGPGLDPHELMQAFAPHQRIARTSTGQSGAGLGLSLSQSLAHMMGARLEAQSTLDVGSKFWLDLHYDPTAMKIGAPHAETPLSSNDPSLKTKSQKPTEHGLGQRVLLVSNDSLRAAQVRNNLERLGHKCLTATSYERAVVLGHKADIDALVLNSGTLQDLHDTNHFHELQAFLDALKASQSQAYLKIVALIPEGSQVDILEQMGVEPVLLPLSEERLQKALVKLPQHLPQ